MRGDFSRTTHRPNRHYSRVLLQQGRVLLDADWNEQVAIQLQAMRTMMRDLVGPHGGPTDALAFKIELAEPEEDKLVLTVGNGFDVFFDQSDAARRKAEPDLIEDPSRLGRYYVDGILVEHAVSTNEDGTPKKLKTDVGAGTFAFVYLEVWEQHLTWIEENKPFKLRSMREVALDGPDTCSRAQVRWAVEAEPLPKQIVERLQGRSTENGNDGLDEQLRQFGQKWSRRRFQQIAQRQLQLWAGLTTLDIGPGDPCRETAQPRYRGPENRLYRVEIHSVIDGIPAFKWSRENGSVVFPIAVNEEISFTDGKLTLALGIGSDPRFGLRRGDIVEFVTEALDAGGEAGRLFEVDGVDETGRSVTLLGLDTPEDNKKRKVDVLGQWALLRRWDQSLDSRRSKGSTAVMRDGAIVIDGSDEFVLEDGIVVRFLVPTLPPAEKPVETFEFKPDLRVDLEFKPEAEEIVVSANQPSNANLRDGGPNFALVSSAPPPAPAPKPSAPPPTVDALPVDPCRVGDYWLIPARTIPGDVEWRKLDETNEAFEPPHGVARHYAPLAMIRIQDGQSSVIDLRRRFDGLAG